MPRVAIEGGFVLVSKRDVPIVRAHRWRAEKSGYARARIDGKVVRLHVFLARPPRGLEVDHRNRDKRDCRRRNLRIATKSQNGANSKMRSHNTSGYRGVYFCSQTGRWRAEIRADGRGIKIGRFDKKIKAARAYDEAAKKYHGRFAVLNFPNK